MDVGINFFLPQNHKNSQAGPTIREEKSLLRKTFCQNLMHSWLQGSLQTVFSLRN